MKAKQSTLWKLSKKHRKLAVEADNRLIKKHHWEMAFDYWAIYKGREIQKRTKLQVVN